LTHYHYLTIEQRERLRALLQGALDRLHSPDYGVCTSCGRDIPYARLEANPLRERCAACEAKAR
jgi:RNA polymerase-binding transcription factor DksA